MNKLKSKIWASITNQYTVGVRKILNYIQQGPLHNPARGIHILEAGLLKQLRLAKPYIQRWTQLTKEFIVKGSGFFHERQCWGSVILLSLKICADTN